MGFNKGLSAIILSGTLALGATGLANKVQSAITIPTVKVGNPGNPADPATGFGSVPYNYEIGKFEITNTEYTKFLNSVAKTDSAELYNSKMSISRQGVEGSFNYEVNPGFENKPINYVSIFDAIRFTNWLQNGQPIGLQNESTTENGAYDMSKGLSATRNPGALWVLPNENEWYKAAYHQPANLGGDSDDYWLYPTKSNLFPTREPPPGGTNSANIYLVVDGSSDVGAYTESSGFYGTFDQAGNMWEMTFSPYILRGGSFDSGDYAQSGGRIVIVTSPNREEDEIGFRILQIPEPTTPTLIAGLAIPLQFYRRKDSYK